MSRCKFGDITAKATCGRVRNSFRAVSCVPASPVQSRGQARWQRGVGALRSGPCATGRLMFYSLDLFQEREQDLSMSRALGMDEFALQLQPPLLAQVIPIH